jgi:hypothetical protein
MDSLTAGTTLEASPGHRASRRCQMPPRIHFRVNGGCGAGLHALLAESTGPVRVTVPPCAPSNRRSPATISAASAVQHRSCDAKLAIQLLRVQRDVDG